MTEVRDGTTSSGVGSTGPAEDKAREVAGEAQQKAQEAAGQAKNRLAVEVDNRSTKAGEQLRSTAGDVRSVGEELRKQGKDKPAQLAERAAERVERVGDYLHASDGDRILRDAEDFGRRQPWAVMAGGLALGFLASRFLKASSSRRAAESLQSSARLQARRADMPPSETARATPAPGTVPPGLAAEPPTRTRVPPSGARLP